MKDKIIELIKKYRDLSELRWGPAGNYALVNMRIPPDRFIEDLEELLKSDIDIGVPV